jgi:hypothetical protein
MGKDKVELALWRSRLLRANVRGGVLQAACAVVSRHAARLDRVNMEGCNGVPKEYDSARHEWIMGLDDSDLSRHEATTEKSRAAIVAALRPVLTPGCQFTWYSDPRGGAVVRIYDKANRRDCFV